MNASDYSTVQRALGIIEGIAMGAADQRVQDQLFDAVELIDNIVSKTEPKEEYEWDTN